MVDIHSHALFGIDDGAETIEDSIEILHEAQLCGVKKMVLTPHFTIGDNIDEFIKERDSRIAVLKKRASGEGIEIELTGGAEVYINDKIFDAKDIPALAIGGGRVMLTEFKYHGLSGMELTEYVEEIKSHGVTVLVAHPERYSYLRKSRLLVNSLISRNAMMQINAASLFEDSEEGDFASMLLRRGAVSAIGSDVHHPSSFRMRAMAEAKKALSEHIRTTSKMIFDGDDGILRCEAELI